MTKEQIEELEERAKEYISSHIEVKDPSISQDKIEAIVEWGIKTYIHASNDQFKIDKEKADNASVHSYHNGREDMLFDVIVWLKENTSVDTNLLDKAMIK